MHLRAVIGKILVSVFTGASLIDCLIVTPRTVHREDRRISEEKEVEQWIFFRARPSIAGETLSVSFRRYQGEQFRFVETYAARVVVEKDLEFETNFSFCGKGCGEFVCMAGALLFSPVWIPVQLLNSGAEDRGIQTRAQETPWQRSEAERQWQGKYTARAKGVFPDDKTLWEMTEAGQTIRIPADALRGRTRIQLFLEPTDSADKGGAWVYDLEWEGGALKEIREK
jgi:hypothetical protein